MYPHRTPKRPFLHIDRPMHRQWQWRVSIDIASSGYATNVTVTARHGEGPAALTGTCCESVTLDTDLGELIEDLALEACLQACERNPLAAAQRPAEREETLWD